MTTPLTISDIPDKLKFRGMDFRPRFVELYNSVSDLELWQWLSQTEIEVILKDPKFDMIRMTESPFDTCIIIILRQIARSSLEAFIHSLNKQ